MSNVALGKPVEEAITNPTAATDGKITGYTSLTGFASVTWPYTLTVDLGDSYSVLCIRILLWDGLGEGNRQRATRSYKYRLLTSTDHQVWKVIFDSSNDGSNGWQVFSFPGALSVRYVRIHGMWNSANPEFQIVQVEAHDTAPPELDTEVVLARTILTDSLEIEVGDGLPLQARVGGIINGIERLIEGTRLLNPQPFQELIAQLRVQVRDVTALERGMDSIRREIISPVHRELEHSAKLGRFSVWGFWVGLIGGVLAIISIALALVQWLGPQPAESALRNNVQNQTFPTMATPTPPPDVPDPPTSFLTERGLSSFTEKEWTRIGSDIWIEKEGYRQIARFQFSTRITYDHCPGSLFYSIARHIEDVEIFIPDKGCPTMEARIRRDRREWISMGPMKNIQ